ncbi:type II secretion system protein [Nitratiruptor sp. YY09-18]|uniref:type II secretion system protein n=1 Tax=Nitratiruptor sp. YY09-18 TaxID=2724901 RepID=UPI001915C1EE|nr:prepilin-type N-terminal cleavage/methylation domain-containing protein [Nitratiruptor sp. YY09-18]BCD67660.1 hypothetical protein NitYY0918_C0560 [Nitratiruptor sp. YY09-18]
MRRAFTLIELVFVIVVMGILALIGSDILVKVYENKIISDAAKDTSQRIQLALEQIARRLSYRVLDSAIARQSSNPSNTITLETLPPNYDVLEWIGYAHEALRGDVAGGYSIPGYSGFCDIQASDKSKLVTPGSRLDFAKNIILAFSGNRPVNIDNSNNGAAVIFKGVYIDDPISAFYTSPYPAVHPVHRLNNTTLQFENTNAKTIAEHYYLAYSAYALVPVQNSSNDYNLTLYYNYRPWKGENYLNGDHALLVPHISSFRFRKVDKSIELQLCTKKKISDSFSAEICGKKVVF